MSMNSVNDALQKEYRAGSAPTTMCTCASELKWLADAFSSLLYNISTSGSGSFKVTINLGGSVMNNKQED